MDKRIDLLHSATPVYFPEDTEACFEAAANAAEDRLITHLLNIAVGD